MLTPGDACRVMAHYHSISLYDDIDYRLGRSNARLRDGQTALVVAIVIVNRNVHLKQPARTKALLLFEGRIGWVNVVWIEKRT